MLSHSSEKRSVMPGAIGESFWRSRGIKWALKNRKDLVRKKRGSAQLAQSVSSESSPGGPLSLLALESQSLA